MLAAVHLVTLGWITSHILGALYLIAPMALRTRLRVTRADYVVFWIYAVAVSGMAAHFWIAETLGMVWAAPLVIASMVWVGARTLAALRGARWTPASSCTTGWRSRTWSPPARSGSCSGSTACGPSSTASRCRTCSRTCISPRWAGRP
jgi:hypothetical protein